MYAHLERFNSKLKVGSKVKQGEIIAYVGDSGQATGPHLHFEVWKGFQSVDPLDYFPEYSSSYISSQNDK